MKSLSLRLRSLVLAIIALALFLPTTVVTLDTAYTSSLTQAKYNELKLMGLALISAFELEGDTPYMPELLNDEQLNLPESGYMAAIVFRDHVVWQSASSLYHSLTKTPLTPSVGEEQFNEEFAAPFDQHRPYFTYAYSAEFEALSDFEPVHFYIFNDKADFNHERKTFSRTLWQYLTMLGLGLLVILLIGLNRVLSPVRLLISEIRRATKGDTQQLSEQYPPEFSGLQNSINQLLKSEADQRTRYKNSLGDLAHSLKTPLAVALGTPNLPDDAKEPLRQIDALIQRQLKRATLGATAWEKPEAIEDVVTSINNALSKVYRDKALEFEVTGTGLFWGDKTDLMEMLGNVLDNASKAAKKKIAINISMSEQWSQVNIHDDGPGIATDKIEQLLTRGQRLDTYQEGQGIGMAVVADLVDAYQGQLHIARSELGGAAITLRFPVQ